MIINPKQQQFNERAAQNFVAENGGDYYSRSSTGVVLKKQLAVAVKAYGDRIKEGRDLWKGTRPWELVNVTEGLDATQPWIGLEWETGFCTRAHYRATVHYMWQYHNNWALDNEGTGHYRGEFTFPPIEISKWEKGKSMFDSMRKWMASKNVISPSRWDQITDPRTNSPDTRTSDPVAPWGLHVNISVPGQRTSHHVTSALQTWLENAFAPVLSGYAGNKQLFHRQPYGWSYQRVGGDDNWIEFKLFRSPCSDVEVANIRRVSLRLAKLMEMFTANPQQFITRRDATPSRYYIVNKPSRSAWKAFLLGETDELPLTSSGEVHSYRDIGRVI